MIGLSVLDREEVASEPRHWVRISSTCNNHCAFCLDSDVQDGTFVARGEVEAEIDRGLDLGAVRLILSGGEASIHPDFLDLVAYGKKRGYRHVQTITNGRMFAYGSFALASVNAGLDEVTFSLHGHTPDLGDAMTGVPGSFVQTISGIRNVVATDRCVVSGDVVINRRNIAHLREILDLFVSLGVREFDLLMVMPFGRASPGDGGEDLLLDPRECMRLLGPALEMSRQPGIHVWTNRLDPSLLEGFEELIQDPHKLHDEVRGRRLLLEDLARGRKMRCAGSRCSHCFIRDLCSSMRKAARDLERGVPGILRVVADHDAKVPPDRLADILSAGRGTRTVWVEARDAALAAPIARSIEGRRLWLSLRDPGGLARAMADGSIPRPDRLFVEDASALDAAQDVEVGELVIGLNRSTADRMGRLPARPGTRLMVAYLPAATLREACERDVDPRHALEGVRADAVLNLPRCLTGEASASREDHIDLSVVGRDGFVDPDSYVQHFIQWKYYVKSPRCVDCRHDRRCGGIPINLARHAGLGILAPVR